MGLLIAIIVAAIWGYIFIPDYLRKKKAREEMSRRWDERRDLKLKEEQEEHKRKALLKKLDPEVDSIIRLLIAAMSDLKILFKGIDDEVTEKDIYSFSQWRESHAEVIDFHLFKEIDSEFPKTPETFFTREEIMSLMNESDLPELFLEYADEKLGIKRGCSKWDSLTERGTDYEMPNGEYVSANRWFDRASKKRSSSSK